MTDTRTLEVQTDALDQVVCVLDGLTRALDHVACHRRPGPSDPLATLWGDDSDR